MSDGPSPPGTTPPVSGGTLWPPLAASALLLAIVGWLIHRAMVLNGGPMTYALDDSYLHLALARNLVRHGVWGLSYLDGFNSSDSSLLYPVLMAAAVAVFGDWQGLSLALNVAASVAALFYAASMLRRNGVGGGRGFLILAAIVLLVPLPAMIATGMEHSVQILLTLAFVDVAAGLLAEDTAGVAGGRARCGALLALGCLLTSIRYEGLFLVGIVGLLLLCRRRWSLAVGLGVASAAPLTLFGLYSMRQGWYPLPNSVLLKGNTTVALTPLGVWLYLSKGLRLLAANPHMLILTAGLAAVLWIEWRRRRTLWTRAILLPAMTLGVIALHVQFADLGWFYRYEAYLMVLAFVVLGGWLAREAATAGSTERGGVPSRRGAAFAGVAALVVVSCLVMGWRAVRGMAKVPISCHNIYEQQYQMGLFLRRFYEGQGVAANDVGAIDYLADIHLYDIYGLANLDVLRARRANRYDHTVAEHEIAQKQVRVAVVYTAWTFLFGGPLPTWTPVGQWTLRDNRVCAFDSVTFYAPSDALVPELTRALQGFAPSLPASVVQSGLYRGEHAPHVVGSENGEVSARAPYYQVPYTASFFLYPLEGASSPAEQAATLHLDVQSTGGAVRLELVVNGQPVASKELPAAGASTSPRVEWLVPVKWRVGMNAVRLIGQGAPPPDPHALPGGSRAIFNVGEPRWTVADAVP